MTDKSSFLMRSWSRVLESIRARRAALGHKANSAGLSASEAEAYRDQGQWVRDINTAKRHADWRKIFDAAYIEARDKYLAHYSDKQAHDKAVIAAQEHTAGKVGKSVRSVRRALGLSKSDPPF